MMEASDEMPPQLMTRPSVASSVPTLQLSGNNNVIFCQSHEHAHEGRTETRTKNVLGVEMNDPLRTLRPFQVKAKGIYGCCHTLGADNCILCAKSLNTISPFLASCKMLDAERNAVADFVMDNRNVLVDAITWLSARRDWALTCETFWHFSQTYPVMSSAMALINKLDAHNLDGRAMAAWRESSLSMDDLVRPSYCAWMYFPRGNNSEHLRVFYVATRVPNDSDILDYLMVVLQPPKALMDQLTDALSRALDSPRSFAENRQRRRDSLYKKIPANNVERVVEGSVDGDPRNLRATRLDTIHTLRKVAEVRVPRIMLISNTARIKTLQPRPDYIFAPHQHYVNVFTISLPVSAPEVWPGELENDYYSSLVSNEKW